eukprot:3937528-Rhodomonas_salina.2
MATSDVWDPTLARMVFESNHLLPVGVDDAEARDSDVMSYDGSSESLVPPTTPAGCNETHHPGAVDPASLTASTSTRILRPNKRRSVVGGRTAQRRTRGQTAAAAESEGVDNAGVWDDCTDEPIDEISR